MKNQIVNQQKQTSNFRLPELKSEIANKCFGKGWVWWVDEYGKSCSESNGYWTYLIDEVVVTPNGGSVPDPGYSDPGHYNPPYYDNSFDNSGGGGSSSDGSGSYNGSQDYDYNYGLQAVDELGSDIADGSVLALEGHQTSTGFAVMNSASLALTMKGVSATIITALKADCEVTKLIGRIAGASGGTLSAVQFGIGVADGEISPSDWCNGAAAILGITAVFVSAPVVAGILGVSSVVVGVASLLAPGDNDGEYYNPY